MSKQIRISAESPVVRVIDNAPNKPSAIHEDYEKYGKTGYSASKQINRYLGRGQEALYQSIPNLLTETWMFIFNELFPCEEKIINQRDLSCAISDALTRLEGEFEHDSYDDIFNSLDDLDIVDWYGIREVVERFWSRNVYKRNHGFDFQLYDIKRSLILPCVLDTNLYNCNSVREIINDNNDKVGISFNEGGDFTHWIIGDPQHKVPDDYEDLISCWLEGDYEPMRMSFSLFGVYGLWEYEPKGTGNKQRLIDELEEDDKEGVVLDLPHGFISIFHSNINLKDDDELRLIVKHLDMAIREHEIA